MQEITVDTQVKSQPVPTSPTPEEAEDNSHYQLPPKPATTELTPQQRVHINAARKAAQREARLNYRKQMGYSLSRPRVSVTQSMNNNGIIYRHYDWHGNYRMIFVWPY